MTFARERVRVERFQTGIDFRERSLEARVVTLDLDVEHVPDLFDRSERLARHAVP
jgi:hypothetical protein